MTAIDMAVTAWATPEPEQDWIFTFGCGHMLQVCRAYTGLPDGPGISLSQAYVRIRGTRLGARQQMAAMFGTAWASQYATAEAAGVTEYGLTELVLPEVTR